MSIPAFSPGNPIRLPVTFVDQNGNPADPTSVTIRIDSPTGTVTTQVYPAGNIVHDGVGLFHYDLLPPYPSGAWFYRGTAAGALVADTGDIEFTILSSVFP